MTVRRKLLLSVSALLFALAGAPPLARAQTGGTGQGIYARGPIVGRSAERRVRTRGETRARFRTQNRTRMRAVRLRRPAPVVRRTRQRRLASGRRLRRRLARRRSFTAPGLSGPKSRPRPGREPERASSIPVFGPQGR